MQGHVLKPFLVRGDAHAPLSQVFWADVIFIKDLEGRYLLLNRAGVVKVLDMGLARFFHDETDALTREHDGMSVLGTADYLAAEQITAPDRPTQVSDIYALGCTLYYAVTGKVPFPGGTARDKAKAHMQLLPIDPLRLNSELSDEFVEVIADMMAKVPAERIQTAADVITRLAPWVDGNVAILSGEL